MTGIPPSAARKQQLRAKARVALFTAELAAAGAQAATAQAAAVLRRLATNLSRKVKEVTGAAKR